MINRIQKSLEKFLSLMAKGGIYGNMINSLGGGVYVESYFRNTTV